MRHPFLAIACILAAAIEISAQSHFKTAVITLEFPAGAENTGLGETGVSTATTPYSAFHNPASIASLYEETYSNLIYSGFRENLLPALRVPDLYHTYQTFALCANDVLPHSDFAYAYYRNYLDFGRIEQINEDRIVVQEFDSDESVSAHCLAIRMYDAFSFGFALKRYDSRLSPGIGEGSEGTAQGFAVDLGIRVNKKMRFLGFVNINPTFGLSALNLGNDSAQYTSGKSDPIPQRSYVGGSIAVSFCDLVGYSFIYEFDFYTLARIKDEWRGRVEHEGHKIQITPFFALLYGRMVDDIGQRFETSRGVSISFNYQKAIEVVDQVIAFSGFLSNGKPSQPAKRVLKEFDIGGYSIKPNFFITRSRSRIVEQEPHHIRDGQIRNDWTFGLGLVGAKLDSDIRKIRSSPPQDSLLEDAEEEEIVKSVN